MSILDSKDKRSFIASGLFICVVLLLIGYLTFIDIPTGNKDLIITILSTIVGSIAMALGKLLGEDPEELKKLKEQLEQLSKENNTLRSDNLLLAKQVEIFSTELHELRDLLIKKINLNQ